VDAAFVLGMLGLGLVSGVHCAGMCGGIVIAFSARQQQPLLPGRTILRRQAAFNAGRITSYAAAGALAGAAAHLLSALPLQTALYVAANILLMLVGLQLAGWSAPARWVEALGAPLWRRLQPLAIRLTPGGSLAQAYGAGALWGWLPCGLVYGALAAAAASGDPARGALGMAAFGLGTLPWLLAAGAAAAQLRTLLSARAFRLVAGGLVLGFGAWGLARAAAISETVRATILCF
jgi:sulfite exporter TauE/SafE